MRIVLIEDNDLLAKAVKHALQEDGHAVDWLVNGDEADDFLAREGGDLAIVDINLPRRSGIEIIQRLVGRENRMPILIVSARDSLEDRVLGLDAGADDYLVKPFEMDELRARVRALSRRKGDRVTSREEIGAIVYDRTARRLDTPGGQLVLPRRELALWEALIENLERVVSKEALSTAIYGTGVDIEPNAVELLVSRLRRKVEAYGIAIKAIRGLGYIMQVTA